MKDSTNIEKGKIQIDCECCKWICSLKKTFPFISFRKCLICNDSGKINVNITYIVDPEENKVDFDDFINDIYRKIADDIKVDKEDLLSKYETKG